MKAWIEGANSHVISTTAADYDDDDDDNSNNYYYDTLTQPGFLMVVFLS